MDISMSSPEYGSCEFVWCDGKLEEIEEMEHSWGKYVLCGLAVLQDVVYDSNPILF